MHDTVTGRCLPRASGPASFRQFNTKTAIWEGEMRTAFMLPQSLFSYKVSYLLQCMMHPPLNEHKPVLINCAEGPYSSSQAVLCACRRKYPQPVLLDSRGARSRYYKRCGCHDKPWSLHFTLGFSYNPSIRNLSCHFPLDWFDIFTFFLCVCVYVC